MSTTDTVEHPRPYRLWNAKEKEFLRWRCYQYLKNAHLAALIELRWSAVNTTLEVMHNGTGKLHGQYTRTVDSVRFRGGENVIEKAPTRKKKSGKRKAQKARGDIDRETGEIRSASRH